MTELDARRQLLADPHRLSAELRAALAGDARLAALRAELVAMDEEQARQAGAWFAGWVHEGMLVHAGRSPS